jgi:hypothetical protein
LELAIPTTSSHLEPELTSVERDVLTPLLHATHLCTKHPLLAIAGHTNALIHQPAVLSTMPIVKQLGINEGAAYLSTHNEKIVATT